MSKIVISQRKKARSCAMYHLTDEKREEGGEEELWNEWSCNYYSRYYVPATIEERSERKQIIENCKAVGYHEYGKQQQCYQDVCGGEKSILKDPVQFCSSSECQSYNELVSQLDPDNNMSDDDLERAIKRNQYDRNTCCEVPDAAFVSIDDTRDVSEKQGTDAGYAKTGSVFNTAGVYNDLKSGSTNVHIDGRTFNLQGIKQNKQTRSRRDRSNKRRSNKRRSNKRRSNKRRSNKRREGFSGFNLDDTGFAHF